MMKDKIYGVRDPYGNRPLCIGKIVPVNSGHRKKIHTHTHTQQAMKNVMKFQLSPIHRTR